MVIGTKLPDLTRLIGKYMDLYKGAKDRGDWQGALEALMSLNATMPDEPDPNDPALLRYRVVVSTALYTYYNRRAQLATCPKCGVVPWNPEHVVRVAMDRYDLMARGWPKRSTKPVWACPKCNGEFDMEDAKGRILIKHGQAPMSGPHFLGVVPEPPKPRTDTLTAQWDYNREMRAWISKFMVELSNKLRAYRQEYQAQNPDADFDEEVLE